MATASIGHAWYICNLLPALPGWIQRLSKLALHAGCHRGTAGRLGHPVAGAVELPSHASVDNLVHLCSPVVVSLIGNVSLQILLPFLLLLLDRVGYWLLLGAVCRDLATARGGTILLRQTNFAVRAWQRRALLMMDLG